MAGVFGFDFTAIYRTAEILRIPLTPGLVDKIADIEHYVVTQSQKERRDE